MSAEIRYSEPTGPDIKRAAKWVATGNPIRPGQEHGCPLGCIYCNQVSLDRDENGDKVAGYLFQGIDSAVSINTKLMAGPNVIKHVPVEEVLKELKNYPYYNPTSPFLIENFNDPGLDWGRSIDLATRLREEFEHEGPALFITKMPISERRVEEMKKFKETGGMPMVIVTYSGLPREIEPASGTKRIEALEKLRAAGIPTILSMRPMIEGINTSEDHIREMAGKVGHLPTAITVGGLYVYQPKTIEAFRMAGFELGDEYKNHRYPIAKLNPPGVKEKVRRIMREEGVDATVHDHTSCAVAEISTTVYGKPRPDRLAHWAGDTETAFTHCETYCNPKQLEICNSTSRKDPREVITDARESLLKMGVDREIVPSLTQAGLLLVKGGSLTIGELFTLEEACGWQVNNWPNKTGLIYRTTQAIEQDLGDSVNKLAGAIPVGQEWYVFLNGDIDGENNQLATKWIRSRNRARVQVVNAREIADIDTYSDKLASHSLGLQTKEQIKADLEEILQTLP